MDNETPATDHLETSAPTMPRAQAFEPAAASPPAQEVAPYAASPGLLDDKGRAGVFGRLVQGDSDIAGLVAYSIYKQHKLDWLRAFEAAQGRVPTDAEAASYLIGEGTVRRIATYRHLAEATLSGHGPGDHAAGETSRFRTTSRGDRRALTPGLIAAYAIIAVLFVVGFWLALHFTVATR